MKIFKILLIIPFILNSYIMFSQNQNINKKVEKIKSSGRDSIIKSALKIIGEDIDLNNFMVEVKANKSSVIVSFHIPIIYVPLNSVYCYDFGADLITESSWSNIVSNPEGFGINKIDISYYTPTSESQKNIQFVINAINNSDEIGSVDIQYFDIEDCMIIRDNPEFYDIKMLSTHQESFYKIDKESGKIYDSRHAHLIPPPVDEDNNDTYEEIK